MVDSKGRPDTSPAAMAEFSEGLRETEQAEGVPPDSELYGQFLTEQPVPSPVELAAVEETPPEAAEETTAATETPPEPEPEERIYANQYRSVEALEQGAVEKQAFIDQLLSEARAREALLQQQAQQPQPYQDPGAFENLIDERPELAVQDAIRRQDAYGYQRALAAWKEVDDVSATQFIVNAALAQQAQQFQQAQQPLIDQAQRTANEEASRAVAAEFEDFDQVISTLTPDQVDQWRQTNPVMARVLQETAAGTVDDKKAVFRTLYAYARLRQDGTVRQVAQQAVVDAAVEARAAKQEATVASASTTTPPEVPETEDERMTRVMREFQAGRNMRSAWTGQETRR